MTASDSTPCEGKSADGASDPDRAAALLLSRELSRIEAEAVEELNRASRAAYGGELTAEHVRALRSLESDLHDAAEAAATWAPDEFSEEQARQRGGVEVETVVREVDEE